jgi:hypothetical protein
MLQNMAHIGQSRPYSGLCPRANCLTCFKLFPFLTEVGGGATPEEREAGVEVDFEGLVELVLAGQVPGLEHDAPRAVAERTCQLVTYRTVMAIFRPWL